MNALITALVDGKPITDEMVEDMLYEICDREHSSCNPECPVFEKFGCIPWVEWTNHKGVVLKDCCCFKSGRRMLYYLRTGKFLD